MAIIYTKAIVPDGEEQRWALAAAAVIGVGAARMKRAAGWWIDRVRHIAGNRFALCLRA